MANEVENRIKSLAEFIRENNNDILTGSEVAIKKLEKEVVEFCKWASEVAFEEIEPFRADVEFLADYLKKISEHLHLDREGVMKQVEELNARKRASRAYLTTNKKTS